MPTSPNLTENADKPLSSDELAGDLAVSSQSTDPLDKPDTANTSLPASESGMNDDPDDRPAGGGEEMLTKLPPG
jgi:hypothetical protein